MNLAEIFIRRPVATALLAFAVVYFGVASYFKLPVSDLPNIEFPSISVTASYPGASPDTMVSTVTAPLEREFALIAGLTLTQSSTSQGFTSISLSFAADRKINDVAQDVQGAISRAMPSLPRDLPQPPTYQKFNSGSMPIMYLTLNSGVLTPGQLYDFAKNEVASSLTDVEGVAQVQVYGTRTAFRVEADIRKVEASGLTLAALYSAISAANSNLPAGVIAGTDTTYAIQPSNALQTAAQLENLIVHASEETVLRVRDLAKVTVGVENMDLRLRVVDHGRLVPGSSVVLAVFRLPGKNTVAIAEGIKHAMPRIQQNLPSSLTLSVLHDQSLPIVESIDDVKLTLVIAFFLVIAVVAVFLGRLTDTLIPSVAIPFTLLLTFVAMQMLGYSLDNLSMMALTLSIGFVVDDAIVVLEDTVRRMELHGETPFQAALQSARQIGPTIISVTVSLAAIFLPLLFMGGMAGLLFREFSVVIMATIFLSGLVAIVITPAMCARMLRGPRGHACRNSFEIWFDRLFEPLCRYNESILTWCLKHRWVSVVVWVLFFFGTLVLGGMVTKGFIPTGDSGALTGSLVSKAGASRKVIASQQDQVTEAMIANPSIERGIVMNGMENGGGSAGTIFAVLKPKPQRPQIDVVAQELRGKLAGMLDGQVYLSPIPILIMGGSGGTGFSYTLSSNDKDALYRYALQLRTRMAAEPSFVDVRLNVALDSPSLFFDVQNDRAGSFGLTPAAVQQEINLAFSDSQITSIKTPTSQYPVLLSMAEHYRRSPVELVRLHVPTASGEQVALGDMVTVSLRGGPAAISRANQRTSIAVNYSLAPGVDFGAAQARIAKIAGDLLPATIRHGVLDESQDTASASGGLIALLLVAVVVMYLVLGILYESYVHPLTVLSSLPVAAYGGLLTLVVFNAELNLFGFIGLFLLLGLVKKNGIMMIDFALHYRKEHPEATAAVAALEASKARFRPILMTTLAAIFGAIPIALGYGADGESRRPLGLVVVGGLLLAQVVTIYVTPVIYVYLDKIDAHFRRRALRTEKGSA